MKTMCALYAIFENELHEELHSGRTMQDSLHACLFALVYADDLVGIATSPTALQDQIITPCYQYSRRYGIELTSQSLVL